MASYLDKTGLQYFWDQIKTKFATLAFKTVRVTNNGTNTDIQADTTADMFTLIAGSNITLTPNATTDTITIAAASGAQPTSTTPKMDGTAAVGSESTFARGDHVHPTDTSRQAKITASGILKGNGSGAVSAATAGTDYQSPLVSGTNIKTINNESLLGSGNIDISGSGSSTLFVTVTYANYAYTADTTYTDMMSAISAGKDIVVILIDSNQQKTWYYTMTYAPKSGSSENFCFATENETGWISHLLVNAGNSWWAATGIDLSSYAKKASPTFTGTPKAPTAASGTNTTQIATTAFVKTAIDNAIGSALTASY